MYYLYLILIRASRNRLSACAALQRSNLFFMEIHRSKESSSKNRFNLNHSFIFLFMKFL